jgi:hypothetical protein
LICFLPGYSLRKWGKERGKYFEQVFEYNWSKYLYYLVKHVGMGFTGIQGLR